MGACVQCNESPSNNENTNKSTELHTVRSDTASYEQNNEPTQQCDLIEYLKQYNNYQQLSSYLKRCFAHENLDFITAVVLFRQLILSKLNNNEKKIFNKSRPELSLLEKLYSLKFEYLPNVYNKYQQKIDNDNINEILFEIHDKFLVESSVYAINISGETKKGLLAFFEHIIPLENKTERKYLYLDLFSPAMSEIHSILDVQYVAYCHQLNEL